MIVDPVGHEELRVLRPVVVALGQPDFLLAQGLAVGGAGVLLVGRAPADVAVDDDQGRPLALLEEVAEGAVEQVQVVGVAHPGDVPAVAQETRGDVLAEGQRGVPLDRDVVVVVDPAEVGELPVGGERGGLGGDALHHAAVAAQGVDVEVDQVLEAGAVVACGHPAARHRHADAVGQALPERPGCRLDARGPAVLRVAGAAAMPLAERLDRLERHRRLAQPLVVLADGPDAGQVQQRVEQHRGVAGRKHEAVAVGPDRVLGVETQHVLPQVVADRGHRHGRPGVPRVRGLDRVDGEGADRVDADLVERVPAGLDGRALVDRDRHALPPRATAAPLAAPAASKMFDPLPIAAGDLTDRGLPRDPAVLPFGQRAPRSSSGPRRSR